MWVHNRIPPGRTLSEQHWQETVAQPSGASCSSWSGVGGTGASGQRSPLGALCLPSRHACYGFRLPLPEGREHFAQELRSTLWPRKYFTIVPAGAGSSASSISGAEPEGGTRRPGWSLAAQPPGQQQLSRFSAAPKSAAPPPPP